MLPLSRRSLSLLSVAGFFLAGTGWLSSWNKSRLLEDVTRVDQPEPGRPTKTAMRPERLAPPLLKDPRSARLLKLMEEIDDAATPGEPNARFLRAVSLTLEDSSFHRRKRDFSLLLDKMTKDDAPAIHEAFEKLEREGRPFAEEYADFASRWGRVDGAGAMAYWSARDSFDIKPNDFREVMTGWGSIDPQGAMEWVSGHRELLGPLDGYTPVVTGWLQKEPAEATAWLAGQHLSREELGKCLVDTTLDKLYSDGMEGMSAWLASLPDTEDLSFAARQGWIRNQYRFQNLDAAAAAAAWSEVGDQPWMGIREFATFTGSVARANQGDLQGFMDALSQEWPSQQISAQFERWAEQDAGLVGAVLSNAPPSDFRRAAIKGMLGKLGQTDPGLAAEWRRRLED